MAACPQVSTSFFSIASNGAAAEVQGLPLGVVLAGGSLTATEVSPSPIPGGGGIPVVGAQAISLVVDTRGLLSAVSGSLLSNTTYLFNGTLRFSNAPEASIVNRASYISQFFGWGTANPSIPATSGPATSCDTSAGSVQSYTAVGEFKVYRGDCVSSLTLNAAEWSAILTSNNGFFPTQRFEQLFSTRFRDSFDFIVFVLDSYGTPPGFAYAGVYKTAQTRYPVRKRRYLGNMVLTFIRSPQNFANPIQGGPILHEFMHEWANNGLIPSPSDASHWGFSSAGGQLGGFLDSTLSQINSNTWKAKGPSKTCLPNATPIEQTTCLPPNYFGTFVNGGNSVAYSQLELFAMGLVASSSVPSIKVAIDGAWSDQANGVFTATKWQTVTADQMFAAAGGKIPPNSNGQRNFRIATVVLTPNNVLDVNTLTELNSTLSGFAKDGPPSYGTFGEVIYLHNFYTATKGNANVRAGGLSAEAR